MDSTGTAVAVADDSQDRGIMRARLMPASSPTRDDRVKMALDEVRDKEPREAHRNDNRHRQNALLVIADVPDEKVEALEDLLKTMASPPAKDEGESEGDIEVDGLIPFLRLSTVHFARVLIHPRPDPKDPRVQLGRNQPEISAQLVFATDYDGSFAAHLDELVEVAGGGLRRLFEHCTAWPRGDGTQAGSSPTDPVTLARDLRAFIRKHRFSSDVLFVGARGRSVHQIRREDELRRQIQRAIDGALADKKLAELADQEVAELAESKEPAAESRTPALDLYRKVRREIQERLPWTRARPARLPRPALWLRLLQVLYRKLPTLVLKGISAVLGFVPIVLLALAYARVHPGVDPWNLVALVLAVMAVTIWLSHAYLGFLSDRDDVIVVRDAEEVRKLAEDEDKIVQNQMSSVIFVKEPLWFRLTILRGVLRLFALSSRFLFVEGKLGSIESIHFARWVLVDGGRRLLFFSNFDGSWESYLGEFVDKGHDGLTSIWSNCVGFPRTVHLSVGGAIDEERFKAYSRASQVRTGVWYSAHKSLTVDNINQNSRIRLGLSRELKTEKEAQEWLGLL